MSKELPSGIATFRDIIRGNFLYVDKTQYIYQLVSRPKGIYFLSRPRRFGKSLLISTLDELFQGNRALFQGLWIDSSDYNWESYPVIRIDFSRHPVRNVTDLEKSIRRHLKRIARKYNVSLQDDSPAIMFEELIFELSEADDGKQVVILIDEYDKPIIDHIENVEEARWIRDALKGFYTVVKSMESHIRMVLITGISKFARVSIFSELNNLTDLTINTAFGPALGLTESEIRINLVDHITQLAEKEEITNDALLDKMRHWYNGFCFAPEAENVYNPFSILLLLYHQRFSNYWFESGTPTFLIRLIHKGIYDVEQLNDLQLDELAFSTYDIANLSLVPLLFQTGYLTIKDYDKETRQYTLGYPNYEVENSFVIYLLDAFSYLDQGFSLRYLWQMIGALRNHDIDKFFKILQILFANIDYDLHLKYEKYYQTIFYLIFKLMGLHIHAEVKTNDGRIDSVVNIKDRIYLFEFKLDGTANEALTQIKEKQYFQKYWLRGKPIMIVGANFDTKKRTVDDWKAEEVFNDEITLS